MEKMKRGLFWGLIASESVHIFCCVLPTIFSVLSLMAGMGMIATMPGFIDEAHHIIHDFEIPMIIISGMILILGWGLYFYSRRISCRTQGSCSHEPCTPKKDRTRLFMVLATILFFVNITVYFTFHQPMDVAPVHVEVHK
jgi:hypothetical protein